MSAAQSYVDHVAPHERFKLDVDFRDVIHCFPGEHILSLHPFGWHLDGRHIPNCPEQWGVQDAMGTVGMTRLVQSYGDYIHIVRKESA